MVVFAKNLYNNKAAKEEKSWWDIIKFLQLLSHHFGRPNKKMRSEKRLFNFICRVIWLRMIRNDGLTVIWPMMGFCLFDCWPLLLQSYKSLFQVLNFISDCKSCFVHVFVWFYILLLFLYVCSWCEIYLTLGIRTRSHLFATPTVSRQELLSMLICLGWSFQGLPSNQVRKAACKESHVW